MILTMTVHRTPSQRVSARISAWAPGGFWREIAAVQLDPHGPMTADDAALFALRELAAALERHTGEATQYQPPLPLAGL